MIGGTDIIIPIVEAQNAMGLAIRAAVRLWPRAVIEDADTGETMLDYSDPVLAGRQEILIYRDAASQAAWKELGADESLDGTMIHLIVREGELTIAVDDVPDSSIRDFANDVRAELSGRRKELAHPIAARGTIPGSL